MSPYRSIKEDILNYVDRQTEISGGLDPGELMRGLYNVSRFPSAYGYGSGPVNPLETFGPVLKELGLTIEPRPEIDAFIIRDQFGHQENIDDRTLRGF